MPVRYYLGPIVPITLPGGHTANGSACFRYFDGAPARVSIVRRGGFCLTRFEATAARLLQAAQDADLDLLPDRDEGLTAAQRVRVRAWLAARGLTVDDLPVGTTGRAVVVALARRITGVERVLMGPDEVTGAEFGQRIR